MVVHAVVRCKMNINFESHEKSCIIESPILPNEWAQGDQQLRMKITYQNDIKYILYIALMKWPHGDHQFRIAANFEAMMSGV